MGSEITLHMGSESTLHGFREHIVYDVMDVHYSWDVWLIGGSISVIFDFKEALRRHQRRIFIIIKL